jgi:hypothetical protein
LTPRIKIGGVILLNEYGLDVWLGETLSAKEFLSKISNFSLEVTHSWLTQPSAIIKRQT